LESSAAIRRAA